MTSNGDYLLPPKPSFNIHYDVPLSPPIRPPFEHYHSSSTLPPTPHTAYPPPNPDLTQAPMSPQTQLKPYLTLPPRILLVTLTPALLPLLMTIAHLFQTRSSSAALASQLKNSILSACSGLATGAASLQSLPRYLAMQTNDEMVKATQASILAIGEGLIDVVTIVETVVTFMVDTYRSFLLCTIQLAVQGTLDILIGAVQTISTGVTDSLNAIRTNIQNDISAGNTIIQKAVSGINTVAGIAGVTLNVPNITIPSLTSLENVTIPTTFESTLLTLNSSLPSLTDLKTKLDQIIDTPFELLKQQINSSRLEMASSFNSSMLPVPSLNSLSANNANDLQSQLCSGLDTSLVDDTANALHKLAAVAIGLMFMILVLIWVALCVWEWRRWRAMKGVVEEVEAEWERERVDGRSRDAWRMVAIVEHPILERYGTRVLERVTKQQETRTNIRWYLSYLAHPTPLALLLISLLGLITLEFQLLALSAIKSHATANANLTVTASTQSLTRTLNAAASNSSLEYALEVNAAIASYEARIQEELFGTWLNTTAVTLNQTLVEFYDEVENLLNATFGNTILFNPINTFIYCILGSKITNLEQGLTWLSDHSKITLPTMANDTLLLSNTSMNELVAPITAAAVGSSSSGDGSDADGGLVGDLIAHFESALIAERNFYAIILGAWVGFALIGLIVVLWNSGLREKYYSWRGEKPTQFEEVGKSKIWPWGRTGESHPIYDEYNEKDPKPSIPKIIEPTPKDSFFNYQRNSTTSINNEENLRPFIVRNGTFGTTLSALAAPGQAFLRLATPSKSPDTTRRSLVENGESSEKYNQTKPELDLPQPSPPSPPNTPPPIWVNRFYGVLDSVKTLFPTRGQKHGEAILNRQGSQRTERSFGASRVPTATTPAKDWGGNSQPHDSFTNQQNTSSWGIVEPSIVGRSFDGESRYPKISRGVYNPSNHTVFPRPMSRDPTLYDPSASSHHQDSENTPPNPPSKLDSMDYLNENLDESYHFNDHQLQSTDHHHDHDYSESPFEDSSSVSPNYPSYYHSHQNPDVNRQTQSQEPTSPTSSNQSYFASQPHVESANRVKTGTAALAAVIDHMEKRRKEMTRTDDPFDDHTVERDG